MIFALAIGFLLAQGEPAPDPAPAPAPAGNVDIPAPRPTVDQLQRQLDRMKRMSPEEAANAALEILSLIHN